MSPERYAGLWSRTAMRHTVTMGGGSRGIRRAGPARDLEARRLTAPGPPPAPTWPSPPPTAADSAHAPAPGRPRQSRQTRASVPPTRRPPGVPRPPLPVPQARARGRARAPVTWEAEPSTRRFARDLGSRIGGGHARRSSAPAPACRRTVGLPERPSLPSLPRDR